MQSIREKMYLIMTDQARGFLADTARIFLSILSGLYYVIIRSHQWAYQTGILRCRKTGRLTISVGNLTMGGVGKTPLVIRIAQMLKQGGLNPAVLIRGYMPGKNTSSDEASLLEKKLPGIPIIIGRDRCRSARLALADHSIDAFILDDGFQYRKVARDIDIVAVDATNPFGNGKLLPRGILREPVDSLKRADILVITKADIGRSRVPALAGELKRQNPSAVIAQAVHKPKEFWNIHDGSVRALDAFNGEKICSFCGIANPAGFRATLETLAVSIVKSFEFPDHYAYSAENLTEMIRFAVSQHIRTILTTAKDAVKLKACTDLFAGDVKCFVLEIDLHLIEGEKDVYDRIRHLL